MEAAACPGNLSATEKCPVVPALAEGFLAKLDDFRHLQVVVPESCLIVSRLEVPREHTVEDVPVPRPPHARGAAHEVVDPGVPYGA